MEDKGMDGREIVVPIEQDDNMRYVLNSCLKKDGLNTDHSTHLRVEGHQERIDGDLDIDDFSALGKHYTYELLRYYAQYSFRF